MRPCFALLLSLLPVFSPQPVSEFLSPLNSSFVSVEGRTVPAESAVLFDWPCVKLSFVVSGKGTVGVRMDGGGNRFRVRVVAGDDYFMADYLDAILDTAGLEGETDFTLFSTPRSAVFVLSIQKISEAWGGADRRRRASRNRESTNQRASQSSNRTGGGG